jgi:hypothetical protein
MGGIMINVKDRFEAKKTIMTAMMMKTRQHKMKVVLALLIKNSRQDENAFANTIEGLEKDIEVLQMSIANKIEAYQSCTNANEIIYGGVK